MQRIGSITLLVFALLIAISSNGQNLAAPTKLLASGPNENATAVTVDWDKLIGEWDVVMERLGPTGAVLNTSEGSWNIFWVLDGHVVQDVFQMANPYGETFRFVGLRTYNTNKNKWEQVTIDNFERRLELAEGTSNDEMIMLNYTHSSGAELRATYYNITEDGFEWKQEKLDKHTGTWNMGKHVTASRHQ